MKKIALSITGWLSVCMIPLVLGLNPKHEGLALIITLVICFAIIGKVMFQIYGDQ